MGRQTVTQAGAALALAIAAISVLAKSKHGNGCKTLQDPYQEDDCNCGFSELRTAVNLWRSASG